METLIGAVIGIILLIFLVLPILAWKDYGISYREYLDILFKYMWFIRKSKEWWRRRRLRYFWRD